MQVNRPGHVKVCCLNMIRGHVSWIIIDVSQNYWCKSVIGPYAFINSYYSRWFLFYFFCSVVFSYNIIHTIYFISVIWWLNIIRNMQDINRMAEVTNCLEEKGNSIHYEHCSEMFLFISDNLWSKYNLEK